MNYVPGGFYRICEVCGFQCRASETMKRWDGLFVCRADFEPRHPQDFVRGRRDDQTVPNPRPEPVAHLVGPLQTALSAIAAAGTTTISVENSARFESLDRIGVMLDSGNMESHIIFSVPTTTSIHLTEPMGGTAGIGNIVIDYSAVSAPDIG